MVLSRLFCACETLAPESLKWLIAHGADPNVASDDYGACVQMLVGTYSRDAVGKQECLQVFADAGFQFPDMYADGHPSRPAGFIGDDRKT